MGLNDVHRISSWRLPHDEGYKHADVVHIHGLHSAFLSYLALPSLTRDRPGVFTLRDAWPMTGHCIFPYDCERWQIGCGKCPYPDIRQPIRRDATKLEVRLKHQAYKRSNIVFVAQNRAQLRDAEASILASFRKVLIPASVDTDMFHPVDRSMARNRIGLDQERMVVMFTATNVAQSRKGGDLLQEALRSLPIHLRSKVSLLALGRNSEEFIAKAPVPGVALPFTDDQHQINLAHNAADVLAFPSSNETFGRVWAEALATGTPVVAFAVGGVPDHLTPDRTGVVVPTGSVDGLADGISQMLAMSGDRRLQMRESARDYAVSELSSRVGAERYLELYRSLL